MTHDRLHYQDLFKASISNKFYTVELLTGASIHVSTFPYGTHLTNDEQCGNGSVELFYDGRTIVLSLTDTNDTLIVINDSCKEANCTTFKIQDESSFKFLLLYDIGLELYDLVALCKVAINHNLDVRLMVIKNGDIQ